jgi:hypothetical protein
MKRKLLIAVCAFIGYLLFITYSTQSQDVTDKAIDNLLKARLEANENGAKARIQTIALASETYASINNGSYPTSLDELMGAQPPYIPNAPYADGFLGYKYSFESDPASYSYKIVATPQECGKTGIKIFIKESGKEVSEQDCQ